MAFTVPAFNSIGPGVRFTFAAAGDGYLVSEGVIVASTDNRAIVSTVGGSTLFVNGTVAGENETVNLFGEDNRVTVGENGILVSNEGNSANVAVFFGGGNADNVLVNHGVISAPRAIGVAASQAEVTNTGRIDAGSPVFLGLFGVVFDSRLVNSGTISASSDDSESLGTRYNNGVFFESEGGWVTNTETGVISAVALDGAGVRFADSYPSETDGRVINAGEIASAAAWGVDASLATGAAGLRVDNTGTIAGGAGAVLGTGAGDTVTNAGAMLGDVLLAGGADLYRGRGAGFVEGIVIGGAGSDTLIGGDGDDTLNGGPDADTLRGGAGDDSLTGGVVFFDRIFGGAGDDTLEGNEGNNRMFAGPGDDQVAGGPGDESLYGGAGDDLLTGAGGSDTAVGGDGEDTIRGDAGIDYLYGGGGDDVILGGPVHSDWIWGQGGDDRLEPGEGASTVSGGAGEDTILGGAGSESLSGGGDDDLINGGAGSDTMRGGAGDDTMNGSIGIDDMYGGAGDDEMVGGDTNSDRMFGGTGDDTMGGGGGNNLLHAGPGDDVILGGAGADTIVGGRGDDTVSGGATGADIIVFRDGDGRDVVQGHGPGDRIDLSDFGVASYAALQATYDVFDVAAGMVIDLGDGDRLLIEGESVATLNNTDFLF